MAVEEAGLGDQAGFLDRVDLADPPQSEGPGLRQPFPMRRVRPVVRRFGRQEGELPQDDGLDECLAVEEFVARDVGPRDQLEPEDAVPGPSGDR